MHMSKVKSFGSEGRRGDNEVPPNANEIESVIFKTDHIRGFRVVTLEELGGAKLTVPATLSQVVAPKPIPAPSNPREPQKYSHFEPIKEKVYEA